MAQLARALDVRPAAHLFAELAYGLDAHAVHGKRFVQEGVFHLRGDLPGSCSRSGLRALEHKSSAFNGATHERASRKV